MTRKTISTVCAAALLVGTSGCVTIPRDPFTEADHRIAYPVGFPHVRYAINDPAMRAMSGPMPPATRR
ncbi:hypothetical protein BH10PSE15_BH10PSE15_12090 [soil metagenome]